MDTTRTPKPLLTDDGYIFDADQKIVGKTYDRKYAAHIVKCVNLHDELVAMLRDLLEATDDPENDADGEESVFVAARGLLTKAGQP